MYYDLDWVGRAWGCRREMVGKDGRWGYLEEEGALKNMELGVVVVRDKVRHGHSLVCRDAKRDVLYTRH
jgi:hypothetical protein